MGFFSEEEPGLWTGSIWTDDGPTDHFILLLLKDSLTSSLGFSQVLMKPCHAAARMEQVLSSDPDECPLLFSFSLLDGMIWYQSL